MHLPFVPQIRNARNVRAPVRPVPVRPSGEGAGAGGPVTASGNAAISIANMPPGGHVYVNDTLLSTVGGRWQGSTWLIPFSGPVSRIRVTNADGSIARGEEVPFETVTEFDFNALPAIAVASPTGLLAIEGLPAEWSVWVPVYRAPDSTVAATDSRLMVNGYLRLGQSAGGSDPTVVTAKAGPFTAPELKFRSPDGSRWVDYPDAFTVPVNNGVVVNASALFAPAPPRGSSDVSRFGGVLPGILPPGGTAPIATTAPLTVVGPPGWQVAIALQGSTTPLGAAVIPATGGVTVPVEPRAYDLLVSNGAGAPVLRTIRVPPAGLTVDLRSFFAAASPPAGPAPSALRTGIVVVGMPHGGYAYINGAFVAGEWLDAGQTRWFLSTPPAASVTLQIKTRDQSVVRQGPIGVPADRQQEVLYDALPLLPVASASPPAGSSRATQGQTNASATTGTILLSGAPPQSTVRVAGLADYTINDSLLPVALDVPPGTVGVTVIPPGSVQRTASVLVTQGATTPLAYGSMATPSNVEVAVGQCGLIPNPPPGVPESVCEGVVYPATDGTRWLGVMREGKVGLVRQVDVPTPTPVAAEGRPWGLYALAAVAIGGGAWWWLNRDEKESPKENPGKKCSCQRH